MKKTKKKIVPEIKPNYRKIFVRKPKEDRTFFTEAKNRQRVIYDYEGEEEID